MPEIDIELPEKVRFLFEPHRAKVLYGGRDGIKSWSMSAALLILGSQKPLRILCARETQQSIRESVHQLLSETIKRLGLEEFYTVLDFTIRGKSGTEFIFRGLSNLTASELKSFESIDIVWVEEAAGVTKHSWQVLIPTIRKPGSEIWVSFNPELATDDTYIRWVLRAPPWCVTRQTSYLDNKWLSAESRAEIELLQRADPDTFQHVYGGSTKSTVEGAIYKSQIMKAEAEGRICQLPYDPSLPVRTFWDLGWSDLVCIWFVQAAGFQLRVIDYYENHHQESDHYLQVLQGRGYTYSADPALPAIVWPWDAATKMNRASTEQNIRGKGFTLRILPQSSRAGGIDAVRRMFPRLWFDAEKTDREDSNDRSKVGGLKRLRRYQWGARPHGKEGDVESGNLQREPLHDINSHPADALRTMAVDLLGMAAPEEKRDRQARTMRGNTPQRGYQPFG